MLFPTLPGTGLLISQGRRLLDSIGGRFPDSGETGELPRAGSTAILSPFYRRQVQHPPIDRGKGKVTCASPLVVNRARNSNPSPWHCKDVFTNLAAMSQKSAAAHDAIDGHHLAPCH